MLEIHTYHVRACLEGDVTHVFDELVSGEVRPKKDQYHHARGRVLEPLLLDTWQNRQPGVWLKLNSSRADFPLVPRKAKLVTRADRVLQRYERKPGQRRGTATSDILVADAKSIGINLDYYTSIEQLYERFWWPQFQLYMAVWKVPKIVAVCDFGGRYEEHEFGFHPDDAARALHLAKVLAQCVLNKEHPRYNLDWPVHVDPGVPVPVTDKGLVIDISDAPMSPINVQIARMRSAHGAQLQFEAAKDYVKELINKHPSDDIRNAGKIQCNKALISRNAVGALTIKLED